MSWTSLHVKADYLLHASRKETWNPHYSIWWKMPSTLKPALPALPRPLDASNNLHFQTPPRITGKVSLTLPCPAFPDFVLLKGPSPVVMLIIMHSLAGSAVSYSTRSTFKKGSEMPCEKKPCGMQLCFPRTSQSVFTKRSSNAWMDSMWSHLGCSVLILCCINTNVDTGGSRETCSIWWQWT